MNTETLNKYIFADLIQNYAQTERRVRQRKMGKDGISEEIINSTPITEEDISNALATLNWYVSQVEKLKV